MKRRIDELRGRTQSDRLAERARARAEVSARAADPATLVLAVATAATAAAVFADEMRRRLRRRRAEQAEHAPEPGVAVQPSVAGLATQDAVRVAVRGYHRISRSEVVLFNLFTGFAGAFTFARISTAGIRAGWWPVGNVVLGGRHIHHFVPGIGITFASGIAALLTQDLDRESLLAVPFGVGVGLTLDEAALLLDLRDVYWTREGLLSVHVSLAGISLLGGTLLALRILRRGELAEEAEGNIPDEAGAFHPAWVEEAQLAKA